MFSDFKDRDTYALDKIRHRPDKCWIDIKDVPATDDRYTELEGYQIDEYTLQEDNGTLDVLENLPGFASYYGLEYLFEAKKSYNYQLFTRPAVHWSCSREKM